MVEWFVTKPVLVGISTFFLMWLDWLLTVSQQKQYTNYYHEHYRSYPVNTIEGNPVMRSGVSNQQLIYPKQFIAALIIGAVVGFTIGYLPSVWRVIFLGYVWGIFFLVITQHLNNLLVYRSARQGVSGKIWMHLRTGYKTQAARYFAISILLTLLAILTGSQFIIGVTIAGFTSALRQLLWMRKVPKILETDLPREIRSVE